MENSLYDTPTEPVEFTPSFSFDSVMSGIGSWASGVFSGGTTMADGLLQSFAPLASDANAASSFMFEGDTPVAPQPSGDFVTRDPNMPQSGSLESQAMELAQTQVAAENGDPKAQGVLKEATGLLGDKTMAALLQLGGSMLAGSAQARMAEKKQKRDEEFRQQEIERRERNAAPGMLKTGRWAPQATGLLGAAVAK